MSRGVGNEMRNNFPSAQLLFASALLSNSRSSCKNHHDANTERVGQLTAAKRDRAGSVPIIRKRPIRPPVIGALSDPRYPAENVSDRADRTSEVFDEVLLRLEIDCGELSPSRTLYTPCPRSFRGKDSTPPPLGSISTVSTIDSSDEMDIEPFSRSACLWPIPSFALDRDRRLPRDDDGVDRSSRGSRIPSEVDDPARVKVPVRRGGHGILHRHRRWHDPFDRVGSLDHGVERHLGHEATSLGGRVGIRV